MESGEVRKIDKSLELGSDQSHEIPTGCPDCRSAIDSLSDTVSSQKKEIHELKEKISKLEKVKVRITRLLTFVGANEQYSSFECCS